jgi:outer membrane protein assembly factor BamB
MGSWDGKVYALNGKTGGKKWEFDTGMRVFSSPLVGADNTIYVRSMKTLYALNGNNGAKIWVNTLSLNPNRFYGDSSPVIGPDGTIYVGSHDKKIFAIKSDSKGPAKSPWPMYGQNAERTGRAPK